jgi:peptidyl-prolyl cis-trans isomerase SurA
MKRHVLTIGMIIFISAELHAETVDRIAVSVGNIGITQSEIEQQLRFEKFMDGQPQSAEPGPAQLEAARDRLVRQTLLALEAETEDTDSSGLAAEAGRLLDEVRKLYPDEESYQTALSATGCTQDQAVQRLMNHVRILRLIDQKLRPNAWVEPAEIETYYQKTIVPKYSESHETPPPLEELEQQIRELLLQQEVDQLLDDWLKEIESSRRVKFHPA